MNKVKNLWMIRRFVIKKCKKYRVEDLIKKDKKILLCFLNKNDKKMHFNKQMFT